MGSRTAETLNGPWFAAEGQLDSYHAIAARTLGEAPLILTEVGRKSPGFGRTVPNSYTDAYLCSLLLGRWADADLWLDGRRLRQHAQEPDSFGIFDLRRCWEAELLEPFRALHFYLPIQLFEELADEMELPRLETIWTPPDQLRRDEIVLGLASALHLALQRPAQVSQLFSEHVSTAICLHLVRHYGGMQLSPLRASGGLAPWQQRRAKEFMLERIAGNPSLNEVAQACGMSPRHFARGFKASTGIPPHRWLLGRRIALARRLLEHCDDPLSVIAMKCGFADQSHMNRVFHRFSGNSPGSWRRMQHVSNRRFEGDG